MRVRPHYRTDLTEKQWQIIKKWVPKQKKGPTQICRRQIINAILYLVRTGCQWRNIPYGFPKWKTVYNVFWHWRRHTWLDDVVGHSCCRHSGSRWYQTGGQRIGSFQTIEGDFCELGLQAIGVA